MNKIYRLIGSLISSSLGGGLIFALYLLGLKILGPESNPIQSFMIIIMVFSGSLLSNILQAVFSSLAHSEKYCNKKLLLNQVFVINIFLFMVAFPAYIFSNNMELVALTHLVIANAASNLAMEFSASHRVYIWSGLYGTLFAVFFLILSFMLLNKGGQESILLLLLLPLTSFSISLNTILIETAFGIMYESPVFQQLLPIFKNDNDEDKN